MASVTASLFPPVLIRASAGTGKTYQLSNRYLGLMAAGVPPEQILATTFTRKAAGEILDRVLMRMARAASEERDRQELVAALQDESLTRDRCLELLERLVQNLHRVRICTLDAFFAQVAGGMSLELGLPIGWTIIETQDERRLKNRAMASLLKGDSEQEVARLIHLMTKGEARRSITELLQSTVNSLYTIFQQSDEPAWRNFPKVSLLDQPARLDLIERLAVVELPRHKSIEQARNEDVEIAREELWQQFLTRGIVQKVAQGLEDYRGKRLSDEVQDIYRRLLRHALGVELEILRHQTGATYDLLARFDEHYRRLQRQTGGLRFDDITRCLAQRIHELTAEEIDYRLDAPLAHLLLDEFQDTSSMQWRVLYPLAKRVTSVAPQHEGAGRSFFCVGDVKQAIYGWRGGRAAIFDAMEAKLGGLDKQRLDQSFRSSPYVLEVVNRVFGHLDAHPKMADDAGAAREWSRQFQEHTTARGQLPGYVSVETCTAGDPRVDGMDAPDGESSPDPPGPIALAARRVAELVDAAPGRSIGVLVRTNPGVAECIFQLRRLGIAASEEGGNPLVDSAPVTVILSLLRLADHPADRVARFHVATSPLGRQLEYLDWQDHEAAEKLAARVREQLVRRGYGPTIRDWVTSVADEATSRDRNRLRQLTETAYEYDQVATLRPTDFVQLVTENRAADPSAANVRVMTVHQAKGLQFDIVILPQLDKPLVGQQPSHVIYQPDPTQPIERICSYQGSKIQAVLPEEMRVMFDESAKLTLKEALCVMYVALTRAVHAMHIIISPSKENERSLPQSPAGLLRATLTHGKPLPPETLAFECGDREWWRGLKAPAVRTKTKRVPRIEFTCPPSAALQPTAPSMLEGGACVPVGHLLRVGNTAALARGTAIHALFEQIRWLEDGAPDDARLADVLREQGTPLDAIPALVGEFRQMLANPATARILSRAHYGGDQRSMDVSNERRIAVRDKDRLIAGAIDRLVLVREGGKVVRAGIVDFKTDVLPPDDPQALAQRVEHYRPQQEAYRAAIAGMYRLKKEQVTAHLVFVGSDSVVPVA